MLVRDADAPIVSRSQGALRWIVLDEAHTYIGSRAAEMALLIRRVLHRFEVDPRDVRFVATSATLGGHDEHEALHRFLRDVSGAPSGRVHVVGGARVVPTLPEATDATPLEVDVLRALAPEERFSRLASSREARRLYGLFASSPNVADALRCPPHVTIGRLGRWSPAVARSVHDREARRPDLPAAPRASVLQYPGRLWPARTEAVRGLGGGVGVRGGLCGTQGFCRHCEHPVYEIVQCRACGEVYLEAEEALRPGYGQDDAPAAVGAGGSRRVPARSRRAGRRGSRRRHGRCDVGGPARRTSADHEHRRRYGGSGAEPQHLGRLAGIGARPCLGGRRAG